MARRNTGPPADPIGGAVGVVLLIVAGLMAYAFIMQP